MISYKTQLDREYTSELIDLINTHVNQGTVAVETPEQIFGMEDYLDSFCKRNLNFPPITDQYGDL